MNLACAICASRNSITDRRVIKVELAGEVQRFLMGAGKPSAAMQAIRAVIQCGFGLTDAEALSMKCKYSDNEGDLCTLNVLTLAWMQQHSEGLLEIHVSLAPPAEAARCGEQRAGGDRAK